MGNEKYKSLLLESAGKEMLARLADYLSQSDISSTCYAYKYRVKPKEKLVEKLNRKLVDNPDYQLEDITDVIGLRLVSLFRRDIPELVDMLVSAILHKDTVRPNLFRKDSIKEVIIFSTNQKYDSIIPEVKENLRKHNLFDGDIDVKDSDGYSSIHIVAKTEKNISELLNGEYYLPIEIQIRTVFEDAWGEIDHKYGYVIRSGKEIGYPVNNPEFVLEHLKVLKKFSDACAEYGDLIYQEASPTSKLSLSKGKIISVDQDEDIIERFKALGVDDYLIEQYLSARKVKDQALAESRSNKEKIVGYYAQAAELFRESVLDSKEFLDTDDLGMYLFYFYSRMNEAVCLLSTETVDGIKAASNIYAFLEDKYTDYPLLKMRSAQAHAKLGNSEIAIHKYFEAKQELSSINQDNTEWTDKLPKTDFLHMARVLPKLLGYELWKYSQEKSDKNEKEKFLLQAYDETKRGLEYEGLSEEDKESYFNNLLYYSTDCLASFDGDNNNRNRLISDVENYIEEVEKRMDINESQNIERLDTLAYAYEYTGDSKKSIDVSNRILDLALGSNSGLYNDSIRLVVSENATKRIKRLMATS